ncbi:hypothetical protein PM082_004288 [Marasmius tenuissimus]|nr:hypothetical protein PM082_004288 [Marasmius tenuissimus]
MSVTPKERLTGPMSTGTSKRVIMACTECRKRKVRCNPDRSGVTRPCDQCSRNGLQCRYEPISIPTEASGIKLHDPDGEQILSAYGGSQKIPLIHRCPRYKIPLAQYPSAQRPVACTKCCKHKVRCNPNRSEVARPCERCQTNGLQCKYERVNPSITSTDLDTESYGESCSPALTHKYSIGTSYCSNTGIPIRLSDGRICYGTLVCFCGHHRM